MSTLEKEILRRYRKSFPNDTLKMIAAKTGIQVTRVFRIMNGKPMKVTELEIFQCLLNQPGKFTELELLTKTAALELTIGDIESIINYIERKLENAKILKSLTYQHNEDLIA